MSAGGAAGGAMAGLMIANNVRRLTDGIAVATTAWKALEARGLTLSTQEVRGPASAAGPTRPVLRGEIEGVTCVVSIVPDAVMHAHTEVRANAVHAIDFVVGVHPSPGGILGSIREWLAQDIEVGDATFDELFLVTGKPSTAPKACLDAGAREALTALAGGAFVGFKVDQHGAVVVFHGVETDTDMLNVALDLVRAAARWRP